MVQQLLDKTSSQVIYPESDGKPMADNTKQFRWIVVIKENLELLFAGVVNVFIAGDLLWYPVEGDNTICQAPDVMVVFGRPKGDRGSYRQWEEGNTPPQVVFEILSPGNRLKEMAKKFNFYERYGVQEYYLYDPDKIDLQGWLRSPDSGRLEVIEEINEWTSPQLGVKFILAADNLEIYNPDGGKFLTFVQIAQLTEQERQRAETERQRAETERQRAETERQRAETERQRVQQLEQAQENAILRLQKLGLTPEQIADALSLSIEQINHKLLQP